MTSTKRVLSGVILTIAAVGQIASAFFLYNKTANEAIRNAGWVILWISAIFGWLPMITLKKWGDVPDGKSYVHTNRLVDRGLYGIVRHPQYLAGMLLGLGLALIVQHWLAGILGAVVTLLSYLDTFDEEQASRQKFGEEYEAYRRRVPRVNFLVGIWRLWVRKSMQI
jgi:protein-S-isoprenylcysteine O-methyltransferase Ste14